MKILESYKKIAKSLLIKEDVMGKKIKYKDKDGNEKEATVGGILKKGENHPAYGVAKKMADKGGEEKPKGKVAGKGDFERDFDDDPTRGDPDDAWDDEEGRAKPSGGDIEDHEIEALISPLEVDDFIEKYDDKLSDEQKDELSDLRSDLEDAEGEMAQGIIDDDEYEDRISDIQGQIANVVRGDDSAEDDSKAGEDKEKMDPEKYGYAQTLNKQSGLEFQETVSDYLFLYGHKIPEESYNDIEKWYNELDSGAPEDREEELEQKIADEIEGLEANNESIKIINGKKYKPVKEEKKVTEKHSLRETYERIGGK